MALGYDYVKYRSETTCNPNTPAWLYKLRSSSFKSAPRALLLFQLLVLLISARQFAGAGTAEPTNVVSIMLQLFLLPYVLSLTFAPDPEGPGWRLSGIALLSSLLFIGLVSGGPQSLLFLVPIHFVQLSFCLHFVVSPTRTRTEVFFALYLAYFAVRQGLAVGVQPALVLSLIQTGVFYFHWKAEAYRDMAYLYRKMWKRAYKGKSLWKHLIRNAPGLLTLIFSDNEVRFANTEFVQHFQRVLQADGVSMNELQQKFSLLRTTNSCIAGSLWDKLVAYQTEVGDRPSDEPRNLGEFIHTPTKDAEAAVHYSARVETIRWKDGLASLLHMVDITASKKAQREALDKKYKNLLLTTASHELRTPINGVLGGMQLIDECTDIAKVREYSKMMRCSCKMLVNITDDILDYCLYEGGNLILNVEEVRLREVFDEALESVQVQTKQRGVDLNLNYFENVPEFVKTDRKRLLQILLNLLGNAGKYTFRGAITVTVQGREQDVVIRIRDTGIGINETKKESLFKLFGRISSEESHEGGKRTNSSRIVAGAGSGLGLTVSQALASLLGSGISFASTEGVGSEFIFAINKALQKRRSNSVSGKTSSTKKRLFLKRTTMFLHQKRNPLSTSPTLSRFLAGSQTSRIEINRCEPVDEDKTGEKDGDNFSVGADERTGRTPHPSMSQYVMPTRTLGSETKRAENVDSTKVLIVDDSAFNLLVLQRLLERLRIQTEIAVNGEDAVEKAKEMSRGQRLRGIIMDCAMPIMNGFEATQELIELMESGEVQEVPIIACTAFTDEEQKTMCFECGMKAFINKPVIIDDLKRTLQGFGIVASF